MNTFTQRLYEDHHALHRSPGFSIMKNERGDFFSGAIGKGKKVLDIGCRDGALTSLFLSGNQVTGADIDRVSLANAEKLGIKTIYMDLYGNWEELSGQKFDVIVAGEVLEHLFHPEKIIEKVSRHLNAGGMFVGSVPNAFSLKNRLRYLFGRKKGTPLSDPTHINQFSQSDLVDLLKMRFSSVSIVGLGRFKTLSRMFPGWFAFDLAFVARS